MTVEHFYIHSCHHRSKNSYDNAIIVKEKVCTIDENGNEHWEPKLQIFRDPMRSFYLTKPQYRNHKFKKEFEKLECLEEFRCRDSELRDKLAAGLGFKSWENKWAGVKQLCECPYVYGADIDTETLIKHAYLKRAPEGKSPKLTVGAFDIETEVTGKKRINVITFIHERDVYTVALKEFCKIYSATSDILNIDTRVTPRQATKEDCLSVIDKIIGEELRKNGFTLHFEMVDTELEVITTIFKQIHRCKTDIIGIWNMPFDIPKVIEELTKMEIDPCSVFCSPEVPKNLRVCKFVEDTNPNAEHIVDKWHWFNCTSHSQFIDSMCLYGRLRKVAGRDIKYSLDYISNKELGQGKLQLGEITNHGWSQKYDFLRYIAYNINDVVIMQLMEFKNHDIDSLVGLSGYSLLKNYSKQTICVRDGDYNYGLENGHVPASASLDMFTEWDKMMPKVGGTVLPPEKAVGTRLKLLKDSNNDTLIVIMVVDLDEASMYPTDTIAANISKETYYGTVLGIYGYGNNYIELLGMVSISPEAYSVQAAVNFFHLPDYEEMEQCLGL